jgi:hypothetical protein
MFPSNPYRKTNAIFARREKNTACLACSVMRDVGKKGGAPSEEYSPYEDND